MGSDKIYINQIESFPEAVFQVIIKGGKGDNTDHRVSLRENYYKKLTGGKITSEELIKKSFEFLLEREPKESILQEFELPVIQKYFPEFENKIKSI